MTMYYLKGLMQCQKMQMLIKYCSKCIVQCVLILKKSSTLVLSIVYLYHLKIFRKLSKEIISKKYLKESHML